ncbi:protoporphyrinogen/coproporphyrinogen oxidase [Microbacterium terregens]|uniref:Protoporphyrinogen/coproporphyrinogen oxidase n=1 Tax=Microbacterium terregens TaxID=69363 RepID=A0ABV5T2L9_9MICO
MTQPPVQPVSKPVPSSALPAPTRVLVVGAGVAGLVVARDLARSGIQVTVFDAADRVGGQLASISLAGLDVDAAAESFATRGGAVAQLASELGLVDDLVLPRASPAWLIGRHGEAHPLPAASVLGIPADPRGQDVVDAIGRRGSWRARWDSFVPLRRPEAYRSFGDLVRRRMGARVLDGLVAPVVRGVYSSVPEALSLAQASPGLPDALRASRSLGAAVARLRAASPAGSQVAGLRGGVHRLAAALEQDARAAGAAFVLGARVVSVDASGVGLESGERIEGRVVLASAAAAGPALRARAITLATAVVDASDLDTAPRGTGALVEAGGGAVTARALTHSSAKWQWLADRLPAHRHVVRLSYDEMPDDPEAVVTADLRAITGARIDRLVELDVRTWTRTLEAAPSARGLEAAGEAASVTGLAAIVPAARATAERIKADVTAARQGDAEG